ncbi:MAG: hypothetical protein PHP42_00520 [Bacteroidota bacterium]|nr:hypothetical protein [Bacteroidota bacterium]
MAGGKKSSGVVAISLFFIAFLNVLIIVLPSLSGEFFSLPASGIVIVAIVVPFFLGLRSMVAIESLLGSCNGLSKFFLGIHGLIFLCVVQILVLLQISDFVVTQFYGDSHYSFLVIMIVIAGIYTLSGGLNAVLYANVVIGFFSLIGAILILSSTFFFAQPLLISFKTFFGTGVDAFRTIGNSEPNFFISAAGIALMMFWLMWFELGEMQRKSSLKTASTLPRGIIITSVVLLITVLGVLSLADKETAYFNLNDGKNTDLINYFIGLSFLGGLMGIFALTFQSVGSIVALRLYPFVKRKVNDEEQILVGRLSIVFVVLLSILLISFVSLTGNAALVWYINFLAFFSTPIVAAFLTSLVFKKGKGVGLTFGMMMGEVYGMVTYLAQGLSVHPSFLNSTSAYSYAIEIALVTSFVSVVASKASEVHAIQNFFSRLRVSRSL